MRRIMTLLLCAALLLALCAHAEGDGAAANDLGLYINEVYAAGEGDDWAEIINTGKDTVDLSGMGLSDDPARPMRWTFPAGTTLRANGLIVVTLIGKDADPAGVAGLWAGFALSEGETLILSDANGRTLDQVAIGGGLENLSLGRAPGEDALRVFRAAQFAARLDARVADGTLARAPRPRSGWSCPPRRARPSATPPTTPSLMPTPASTTARWSSARTPASAPTASARAGCPPTCALSPCCPGSPRATAWCASTATPAT